MMYLFIKVMDSYLAVKMSEALGELKEKFVATENLVAQILREKKVLEQVLKEKVQLIKVWPYFLLHSCFPFHCIVTAIDICVINH